MNNNHENADMNTINSVIRCEHLGKVFDEGAGKVSVLDDITLEIGQGECVAIMGRSGAGKSTLLHLLGGLDQPSHGQVWLKGQCLTQMNERQRGQQRNQLLGFVYQFHHLLPEFTALENVAMPLLLRGDSQSSIHAKAVTLLERVGLKQRLTHKPGQLSGGERQRVAIARALVTEPRCVLADEPTGNLDKDNATTILELITELNQEMNASFIIVTHEQALAAQMDRVLVLEEGRLQ
jgi:lipoprotein-releasing system ATP-binding protein